MTEDSSGDIEELECVWKGNRRRFKEQSGIDMSDFESEIFADIKNLCNKLGREDQ